MRASAHLQIGFPVLFVLLLRLVPPDHKLCDNLRRLFVIPTPPDPLQYLYARAASAFYAFEAVYAQAASSAFRLLPSNRLRCKSPELLIALQ